LIRLAIICLGAAFGSLVLASLLPPPMWILALDAFAFSVAAALLFGVAAAVEWLPAGKRLGKRYKELGLPLGAGATAVVLRAWLVEWLTPPATAPTIDFVRLQLAALSLSAALFALVGGVAVASRSPHIVDLALSAAAVTAALYVCGPVLLGLGVPLDHRTFLGLAGIGVGAYVAVEARRRVGNQGTR